MNGGRAQGRAIGLCLGSNIDELRRRLFKVFLKSFEFALKLIFFGLRLLPITITVHLIIDRVSDHGVHVRHFIVNWEYRYLLPEPGIARGQPFPIALLVVGVRVSRNVDRIMLISGEDGAPFLSWGDTNRGPSGMVSVQERQTERHTVDEMLAIGGDLMTTT